MISYDIYLSLSGLLHSVRSPLGLSCVVANGIISFFSMAEQYSIIYTYVYIFLWRWEVKLSGINIPTTGRHMHRTQTQLTEWLPLIRSIKPVINEYLLCAHTGERAYTNFMQWSSHTCAHTHKVLFLHAVYEKGDAQAD